MNTSYIQVLKSMNQNKFSNLSEFQIIKEIGRGGFSKVYLALHKKTKMQYALKKLNLKKISQTDYKMIINELKIHSKLTHPNIVKFHDVIIEGSNLFIILEYCKDGSLFNYIRSKKLSQKKIKNIFKQILTGVSHIHKNGIIIRDLKPENIVKTGDTFKLCDFGWSVFMSNTDLRSQKAGTLAYMSPESLLGNFQNQSSDIWSLGILLYELHFKNEPFKGNSAKEILRAIDRGVFFGKGVFSREGEHLVNCLLRVDEARRLTIGGISRHCFLKGPIERFRNKSVFKNVKVKTVFDHLENNANFYSSKNYCSSKNEYFYTNKTYENRPTENIVQNSQNKIIYTQNNFSNNKISYKKQNFNNNSSNYQQMNFNQRFLNYSPKTTLKVINNSPGFFDMKSYHHRSHSTRKVFLKNTLFSY